MKARRNKQMTSKQEKMINTIKNDIIRYDFHDHRICGNIENSRYEFKEFKVEDHGEFVSVYSVVGLKDDEGTMAACTCRTYRQIFIGKRGGVHTYDNQKKGGKAALTNYSDVMCYGYHN